LERELGAAGGIAGLNDDFTMVNGNLTLGGALNISSAFGFGAGTYELFDATGTITPGTITFGTLPAGFTKSNSSIQTVGHQVDLVVTGGPTMQYWDYPWWPRHLGRGDDHQLDQ
jgi:hypothetical protein